MGSSSSLGPKYARFARTIALVSVALPMPVVTVLGAAACSSSSTTYQGLQAIDQDSGIQVQEDAGPGSGSQPAPGMDSGDDAEVAEGGGGIQAMDASSDAADDGGGPHRGTPELPDSFQAMLA